MTRAMTKYVRDLRSLALVAVAAAACGTKYVADLDTEAQQGSGDGEGGSTDATEGHTGAQSTTAAPTTEGAESTGAAGECEPQASCYSGGDVATTYFTIFREPTFASDDVTDACTLATSIYDSFGDFWRLSFTCDGASVEFTGPLPEATAARIVVDGEYQVRLVVADAYTEVVTITAADGTVEVLAQSGASLEDFGAPSAYGDFTITALDDVCEPTCVPAETCWGQDQQRLVFGLGEDEVEVWDHSRGELGDYAIAVGQATGVEQVHPGIPACEIENLPVYNFIIANVAAP